jgi:hypothetical protein
VPRVEVTGFERRLAEPPGGPDLVWFRVPPGTVLDRGAPLELRAPGLRMSLELVSYEVVDGLPVALGTARPLATGTVDGSRLVQTIVEMGRVDSEDEQGRGPGDGRDRWPTSRGQCC